MDIILILLLLISVALFFLLFSKLKESRKNYKEIFERYKDVIDLDAEKSKINFEISELKTSIDQLKIDYANKRRLLERLLNEVSLYEQKIETMSFGLYEPQYNFDTSEKYKSALDSIRDSEKSMIKNETATVSITDWTINGSATEGRKMMKHFSKLILRAFNGECDALLSDIRWNNISRIEERLKKSFEAINKISETQKISISTQYMKLKMSELKLSYEYQEKLHEEKEEQKRIQEQIREEERAQKEFEKALRESDDEEKKYNKALDQARKDLEKAHGEKVLELQEKMILLEKQLAEARAEKERALSMAQQTKAGHVYVISNIGSFGEHIYKIGMTRRLDPQDRIDELGNASVPFEFDVHAMIYSDNAPELETFLHKEFELDRVNLVNNRKEFFSVPLEKIASVVEKQNLNIEFTKLAEAREFRETQFIRSKREAIAPKREKNILDEIPVSI